MISWLCIVTSTTSNIYWSCIGHAMIKLIIQDVWFIIYNRVLYIPRATTFDNDHPQNKRIGTRVMIVLQYPLLLIKHYTLYHPIDSWERTNTGTSNNHRLIYQSRISSVSHMSEAHIQRSMWRFQLGNMCRTISIRTLYAIFVTMERDDSRSISRCVWWSISTHGPRL